ncbi:MAG: glycosyltransferase [Gammaproteobacteria bacterium]|nr:glycosyltransferase [Gammaproteobacteria bacterium]
MAIVTILIPNYKTTLLTKLCLRLLRKNSNIDQVRVVVIDNDSRDESTTYLRSLSWIDLIERPSTDDDTPSLSHSRALDLALEQVTTPYVLVMHTDTMVTDPKWLDFLIHQIESNENIAGVGSWKLENKTLIQRAGKWIESLVARIKNLFKQEKSQKEEPYLRSHCALYRMDVIRKLNLSFSQDKQTAGKAMHYRFIENGYRMVFLSPKELGQYMEHINHSTMVLNPSLSSRTKSVAKGQKRIQKAFERLNAEKILNDDSLDH